MMLPGVTVQDGVKKLPDQVCPASAAITPLVGDGTGLTVNRLGVLVTEPREFDAMQL
jgi:hypothetical protein